MLVRDVVRLGLNPLRESPEAKDALILLEQHGWIARLDSGTVVRGSKRTECWRTALMALELPEVCMLIVATTL